MLVVTWNLLGKLPSHTEIQELLNINNITHDIYVVGTEECQRSIAASFVVKSKDEWENRIAGVLGPNFSKLCSDTLMATHAVVFVNNKLLPIIKSIFLK